MFTTLKQRLLLGIYIFIILSIPIGAYLASENQNPGSSASEKKDTITKKITSQSPSPTSTPSTSAAKELLKLSESKLDKSSILSPDPEDSTESSSPTIANSFGPTLALNVKLEGRNEGNQKTTLFIGIIEGQLSSNPKFILNFLVDLPESGNYTNLSLAGLTTGAQYTALLKGSAQIATSSAFTMSPNVTNLNSGQFITMLTGDLNDDNVINSGDYAIEIEAFGATSTSLNWKENGDFNKDGKINIIDLAYITKNYGKSGASGGWSSPLPQLAGSPGEATPEASASAQGSSVDENKGYWIWIPR